MSEALENGRPVTVIYIAGLGHSGSTLLELLLASHPDVVGMGEIALQVERLLLSPSSSAGEEPCSCGATARDCEFWGELVAKPWFDRKVAYEGVFTRFGEMFPGKVLVDSSKGFRHLARYGAANPKGDVRPLLILRDFRGWALSRSHTNQRKERRDLGYVFACYHWMAANFLLIWRLSRTQSFIHVAYEDLVFSPQLGLQRVCEALGLSYDESMLEMDAVAHNVLGNRMKSDARKNRRLWYDHRWMMSSRLSLLSPLVFPVHLYQVLQQWWLEGHEKRRLRGRTRTS